MTRNALLILFLLPVWSFAQRHAIGTFFDHLPYKRGNQVAFLGTAVFCQSGPAIFQYNTEDESIERLNTISGLTEMGVSCIAAHPSTNTLVIGYNSGNIDFIQGNEILNRADIIRANIISDKTINGINFYGDTAFVATGFGIVMYDMSALEVIGTLLIGDNESFVNIQSTAVFRDSVYAVGPEGLYVASLEKDLYDFRSWDPDTNLMGRNISHVFTYDGTLYVNHANSAYRSDTVYYKNASSWVYFDKLSNESNWSFQTYSDRIVITQSTATEVFDHNWNSVRRLFDYQTGKGPSPRFAVWNEADDVMWVADFNQGLIKSIDEFNNEVLTPTSPNSVSTQIIKTFKDKVFVAAGRHTDNWLNAFNAAAVHVLEDDAWTSLDRFSVPDLETDFDLIDVATFDGEDMYVAGYGGGLMLFRAGELLERFTQNNSSLLNLTGNDAYVAVSGLAFDEDGDLWVGNGRSSKPLHLYSDGGWVEMAVTGFTSADFTGNLLHTSWGHIWLSLPKRGILVYDYNNTKEDVSDDRFMVLNKATGNGNLPSLEVQSMVEDENGELWVGTNLGLRVFFSPQRVFDEGIQGDASEILITQETYTEVLFDQENVTSIAVDEANRKWIGTQNSGVFLLSSDGKSQVHNFTERNSPLFSDRIIDIGIIGPTGEVLIGTDQGIISYKSDATTAYPNMDDLVVYPNPVRPNYEGLIAIKNLAEGANVKITDASGNLVHETTAQGGQASWDGKDARRQRVGSGVYLVLAASPDGNIRGKAKILITR